MKTQVLLLSLVGLMLAAVTWLVHSPRRAQADEIPEKYRDTVSKGLEYLVKHQHKDGHWEGDDGKHPVAMTGLVGLALFMEGESIVQANLTQPVYKSKYADEIRKAVDWLMEKSQPGRDGLIFSEHPSETARYMEGHGLATLFLAALCENETDEARQRKMRDVLSRAVKYIAKAQSSQGGWYHTSKVEGHDFDVTLATVIQLQALQAANRDFGGRPLGAQVAVPRDAQAYLKSALAKYDEAKPGRTSNRRVDTAAALVCRFNNDGVTRFANILSADELCKKWLKYCQDEIPVGRAVQFGRDDLSHYYYAQTLSQVRGEDWKKYRTTMFDHLQSSQNKDGSWPCPAAAEEGISVGPVYSTALWCTILQLDKGNHPSVPRNDILTK
jgi:hypothetical protein